MRLRVCVFACAVTVLGSLAASGSAGAAPRHNHRLTIAATPNPVYPGDQALVYGRLLDPQSSDQTVVLYQHVVGSGLGYSVAASTSTNSAGFYAFNLGNVVSNRRWFVRGPDGSHSRTIRERAIAVVSINASTTSTDTAHPVIFSGQVTPEHPFGRVFLQQEVGSTDDWRTLRSGRLDANSSYAIPYRWRRPGVHDVRVLFRSDPRNLRGASDVIELNIEQAQVPDFTINSSAPIADYGESVTISGTLDQPGTTTPAQGVVVQLWGHPQGQPGLVVLADTSTDANGDYSFTQSGLTTNTVYSVATMRLPGTPRRHSARLNQGLRDALTMQASSNSTAIGQPVTFTGTVLPDKAGEPILLQKLEKDGDWHTVEVSFVRFDSTFQFRWTIASPGTHTFRARIRSDGQNVGSVSAPVPVAASEPPVSTLPPAS